MATKVLEKKIITISPKRQITIPQSFFSKLGFERQAECILRNDEIAIRLPKMEDNAELYEYLLEDLIHEGFEGYKLLEEFKFRKNKIRPAVEEMIKEADDAANGKGEYYTVEDIFGED